MPGGFMKNTQKGSARFCQIPRHLWSNRKEWRKIHIYTNRYIQNALLLEIFMIYQAFLKIVKYTEARMIWENSTETCILSIVKQITSPGLMHETSAQGWYTRMTQRDGMGREVGGDSEWGTHIHLWLIHVNVWQKPPQYYKVISLQLK